MIVGEDTISQGEPSQEQPNPSPLPPPPASAAPAALKGYVRLVGWRLVIIETCLCLGLLLSIVDASIVAAALVHVEEAFDDFLTSDWVVLSYLITEMGFSIAWARASDIFGRKWSFFIAWVIFTAFSLASGLATSIIQLIIFRALQGIGGSGLYSLVNVIIPEITPKQHFGTMTGAAGTVFAIASVLGPVMGGVISDKASWRWIFFLNVPCGVLIGAIVLLTWPGPSTFEILSWRAKLYKKSVPQVLMTHIDYIGSILLLSCTVLLIFAMQQCGSAAMEWSSPVTIASLTISGSCAIGLLVWILILHYSTRKIPITAILPWHMITRRILGLSLLCTLFTGFPLFITLIAIPQRYQLVDGLTSGNASVKMMPLLFASAFGSTFSGLCNRTRNTTFWTLLGSSCLMVIGCGLLSSLPVSTETQACLYGYEVIFGFGLGMTFSTATTIATMESKFGDYAISVGSVNQARILGGAIGFAASSIMLSKSLSDGLKGIVSPLQIRDIQRDLNVIGTLMPAQQSAVVESIAKSFNLQLRVCTYVVAACVVFSLCSYTRYPADLLKRKKLGEQVAQGVITKEEADRQMTER